MLSVYTWGYFWPAYICCSNVYPWDWGVTQTLTTSSQVNLLLSPRCP